MDMSMNGKTAERMDILASGFDFSGIEKKLLDEEGLKKANWQELLREYEPWLIREYKAHAEECAPQQRIQWEEAINRCHQKMHKRTGMFTILFALLALAMLAEMLFVRELTTPIRGLLLLLAIYCGVNCWSHWLLSRKYSGQVPGTIKNS